MFTEKTSIVLFQKKICYSQYIIVTLDIMNVHLNFMYVT